MKHNIIVPKFLLLIAVLALLLTSTQFASAEELRTVIKEELIESQYGTIGDFFGIGDRLYRVTYEGGARERVWKKSGSLLSKATITETPSGMTTTEGQAANYYFKAQAPNLPRFTGGTGFAEHKFMIYDDTEAQQVLYAEIIEAQVPVATPKQIYFRISNSLPVGKRFYFMKEFVKDKTTGAWVSGSESQSSEWRFEVNVLPAVITPATTRTIRVDTIPTNATITYLNSPAGATAKDFVMQTGQTKILVFSQEGYVTVMKGISSYTTTPFVIPMNKVAVVVPTPEPTPIATTPTPTTTSVSTTPSPTTTSTQTDLSLLEQVQEIISPTQVTLVSRGTGVESGISNNTSAATQEQIANAFSSKGLTTPETPTVSEPSKTENKTYYNIGLAGIILTILFIIGYVAYTNLYIQKGKQKRKESKSPKNKGGMWFD